MKDPGQGMSGLCLQSGDLVLVRQWAQPLGAIFSQGRVSFLYQHIYNFIKF